MTPQQVPPGKSKAMGSLEFILIFLLLFFATNYGLKYFFPTQFGGNTQTPQPVTLAAQYANLKEGDDPMLIIQNNTKKDLPLPSRCPQPPVDIALISKADSGSEQKTDLMANSTAGDCVSPAVVPAGKSVTLSMAPWKYSLLSQLGTYEASLDVPKEISGSGAMHLTARFTINEPGIFTKLFRTFVLKPLFNSLLFIALYVPDHNLGLAIIILTILIKLLLLVPNQHALEGQRKLQQLQPRLDELKKKYPDDAKKQQEETMRLWKEYNINPLQSCLPTLLQFPILIGLFYDIKSGVAAQTSRHLLYSYFLDKPIVLGHMFLGLDLLKVNLWLFPPLLVVLQFIQMWMMMAKAKKAAQKKDDVIDVTPGAKKPWKLPELNQQTVMMYGLPLMIGFFALKFPAAVSLYWAISTLFGIAQQAYVNREKITLKKEI